MRKLTALFDSECQLCIETKKWFGYLDWFRLIEWVPLEEYLRSEKNHSYHMAELKREIYVISADGHEYKGFRAVRQLFFSFPLTFIPSLLLFLPGITLIGDPVYRLIANNRHRLLRKKCNSGKCSL